MPHAHAFMICSILFHPNPFHLCLQRLRQIRPPVRHRSRPAVPAVGVPAVGEAPEQPGLGSNVRKSKDGTHRHTRHLKSKPLEFGKSVKV